ncbi:MAG: hypothetical protein ACP5MG_12015 [Verrucomicrobiia bacterium]
MKRLIYIIAVLIALSMLFFTGCKTSSGSREFIPGKGWVPVK